NSLERTTVILCFFTIGIISENDQKKFFFTNLKEPKILELEAFDSDITSFHDLNINLFLTLDNYILSLK
ncbi:Hypothetical protein FKW44_007921, partial [Caligus rogercresseyi]